MSTQFPENDVGHEHVASYPLGRTAPFSTLAASDDAAWRKQSKGLLSPRERQILNLLATGRTYKEIAREVFLSKDTVKYHCKNVYLKLRARSRTEALVAAAQIGLLQGWY